MELKRKISKGKSLVILFTLLMAAAGCNNPTAPYFSKETDSITKAMVPDKREGICNVEIFIRRGKLVLKGETDDIRVKEAFVSFLESKNVTFSDSLSVLPDTTVIKKPLGLVNLSVCNIRSEPSHDAEMVSQAIMGTPVRILKHDDGWYLIQTPDLYLGWVDSEGIEPYSESETDEWKSSDRVIYLQSIGFISSDPSGAANISDIVAGSVLRKISDEGENCKVLLPDGRTGYLKQKSLKDFRNWANSTYPDSTNLEAAAYSLLGVPYLWGGTSVKGVDCSGFVKTFYFLNGMILARDVSLMFRHGGIIDDYKNLNSLRSGDLLFFGSVRNGKPRPTHIGMYTGNSEFIHSSGMVRVNSLDSTRANFSRYRSSTFLGARRVLGTEPGRGLVQVKDHKWYF